MSTTVAAATALRARLEKGADLLFDIEMGATPKPPDYDHWLRGFEELLAEHEREEDDRAKS